MVNSAARGVQHVGRILRNSTFFYPRTDEDRNTRLLYLSTAMMGVPFGGIMSFLPVFMARLGASETLIGLLSALPALLGVLTFIPGAALSERYSDQVRVRVTASRLYRLAYLACALLPFVVPQQWLPIALVAAMTYTVIPNAAGMPAWTTVMTQAISPRRRAQLNSTRWALLAVTSAVSSAAFGWMLDALVFPINYQVVFFISFALSMLDPWFFARLKVPPIETVHLSRTRSIWARFAEYLRPIPKEKGFLRFLAVTVLYRVALNLPVPLFSIFWVNNLQASDTLIGLRGTVGNGALVLGYLLWGRSANRVGHRQVLWWSAWGLALYPIATALAPTAGWLIPIAIIWGLTVSGLDVGLFDIMLATIPKQRQPLFSAVWSMVAESAIFVGPLLGAVISRATGPGTALLIAGVAQIVATLPFFVLPRHDPAP
ncbi:MAG: MFS transporter [Chloroflexota bacterium]